MRYELVERRTSWSFDRVFYFDHRGTQRSFATNLTDVLPPDPFVATSQGRAMFRVADLLELRALLDRLAKREEGNHV